MFSICNFGKQGDHAFVKQMLHKICDSINSDGKNSSHCQSVWGGVRMNRQSTEDLNCGENTLYGTIMVDTCC